MANFNDTVLRLRSAGQTGLRGVLGCFLIAIMGSIVAGGSGDSAATTQPVPAEIEPSGLRHADLTRRIAALAQKYPRRAKSTSIGKSFRGREIPVIELRGETATEGAARGALLVVAGLSATRITATDVALALAERWADPTPTSMPTTAATTSPSSAASQPASQPAHILDVCDVYILPRLNVDGAERFLAQPREANDRSDEPVDDDRDRAADDNGPADLNGDGVITQMRVRDPEATHMVDDKDARLMRPADRAVGERAIYKMYTESLDTDGDGEYAEDGPGGVELDRNFPHAYQAHAPGTGRYPLSAPETRALAEYVVAHPEILAIVVLDRGDNLAAGGGEVVTEDEAIWKHVAERYKEVVAVSDVPRGSTDGSFAAWVYRQRGLPAVASALWQLPKDEPTSRPTSGPASQPATTQPDGAAESDKPTDLPPPSSPSRDEARPGPAGRPDGPGGGRGGGGRMGRGGGRRGGPGSPPGPGRPGGGGGSASADSSGGKGDIEKERRWLQYADKHPDIRAFVDWTPFKHPTLGDVEIGGFVPGFRENAPADALPDIVDRQIKFCSEFAAMLPRPRVAEVKITEKATDVFEIELSLINEAYLPTALAMTRTAQRAMPFVLRPELPADAILAGRPVEKIPYLEGAGGTDKVRWLVRAARGQSLTIHVFNKQFKMSDVTVDLVPTPPTTQVSP